MCRYGTLIAWAEGFGHDEIVRILTTNLNEEKLRTAAQHSGAGQGRQREGFYCGLKTGCPTMAASCEREVAGGRSRRLCGANFLMLIAVDCVPGLRENASHPKRRHDDIMHLFCPTRQTASEKRHLANGFATVHGVVFGILVDRPPKQPPATDRAHASRAAVGSTPTVDPPDR